MRVMREAVANVPKVPTTRSPADLRAHDAAIDAALLARLRGRDGSALAEIYDRHSTMVYSIGLKFLRDQGRAEDLTHDVFLTIWEHPERYRQEIGPFAPWFYRVARNRAIDVLRRMRRETQPGDRALFELSLPDPDPDPADLAWIRVESQRVREAMWTLPANQRMVIELAYFSGMTQREMAEHLDEPLGTIKTRVRSGLMRLREMLESGI